MYSQRLLKARSSAATDPYCLKLTTGHMGLLPLERFAQLAHDADGHAPLVEGAISPMLHPLSGAVLRLAPLLPRQCALPRLEVDGLLRIQLLGHDLPPEH